MYFYFVGLKGGASHHLTWLPYKKHITICSCFFSFLPHFLLFLHQSEVKKRIGKNVKKHTLAYKRSAKQMYGSQNIQHALVSFFCSNLIFRFSSSRNSVSFSSKAPTAILENRIRVRYNNLPVHIQKLILHWYLKAFFFFFLKGWWHLVAFIFKRSNLFTRL